MQHITSEIQRIAGKYVKIGNYWKDPDVSDAYDYQLSRNKNLYDKKQMKLKLLTDIGWIHNSTSTDIEGIYNILIDILEVNKREPKNY